MARKKNVPDDLQNIDEKYFRTERRVQKFREVIAKRQQTLHLVMEDVFDKHNVSAVLRTCDSAGVAHVHLVYIKEEFPIFEKKSSSGSWKWIDYSKHDSVEECYSKLREQGIKIYSTDLNSDSISIYDVDFTQPVAIVFGNEHTGVSDEARKFADANIKIPMYGLVESLNISVACAITVYEALRQRLASGMYNLPQQSPEELENTLKDWLQR